MASWGIWAFLAFYFWESILGFIALLHLCYHFRRYFFLGIRCINTFLLSIKALISHPLFFLRLLLVIARQLCYEVFESALTAWYLYGGYQIDSLISCLSKKQKKRDEQIEKVREGGLVQVEVRVRKSSTDIALEKLHARSLGRSSSGLVESVVQSDSSIGKKKGKKHKAKK